MNLVREKLNSNSIGGFCRSKGLTLTTVALFAPQLKLCPSYATGA